MDLFTLKGKDCNIIVDHFPNYWEIDELPNTTLEMVMNKIKQQFARHGIPDLIITDNGPPCRSEEFKKFTEEWSFDHNITSAPYYPKAGVKIAKSLLKKAIQGNKDPWIAILGWRNTPQDETSPNQKLMSRKTKSTLPILKQHRVH